MLAGDAYCFLDPVFSSGLMLALKSGVMAADAIDSRLIENDLAPARFMSYARTLREGINNMRILVCAASESAVAAFPREVPQLGS